MEGNLKLEGNFEWKTYFIFVFVFLCAKKEESVWKREVNVHHVLFPE